jgi:glycosyltransferase involved in cell wall biosynthesis
LHIASGWKRLVMRPVLHYLRIWDQATAQRPDFIIANSRHTRGRIKKYWRRDSMVIPPPVDVERFAAAGAVTAPGDYYLCAGQLESYKRVDLAVEAFNRLGLPLVVVGVGPELENVKRLAGPTIRFLGWRPDEELVQIVAGCRALIFPGEEDFGIVPVEAMAAGRPVIAFRHGGVLDSVVEHETGMFFDEQSYESLMEAVQQFECRRDRFDSARIATHARGFAKRRFQQRIASAVARFRADY